MKLADRKSGKRHTNKRRLHILHDAGVHEDACFLHFEAVDLRNSLSIVGVDETGFARVLHEIEKYSGRYSSYCFSRSIEI